MEKILGYLKSIGIGLAVIFIMYTIISINSQINTLNYQRMQLERIGTEATRLVATNVYLKTRIADAGSIREVRRWAYEDNHMIQDGDIPIALIPGGEATPTPQVVQIQATPQQIEPWQVWWQLFFEDLP